MENPYLPSIDPNKSTSRRRKINWPLAIVIVWIGLAALAIGCRLLFAVLGIPMGE
jgi:hypothetical protein